MNALPPAFRSVLRHAFRSLNSSRVAALLVTGLLFSAAVLHSQSSRPGLITQAVNDSDLVTLAGNRHPLATAAADRGPAPASMPAERMLLLLQRSPAQESALSVLIESLHDANSPNYHQWLTPAQFAAQWGAADSDIAVVTAWLESHGFAVAGPNAAHTAIEFSGTAGQIQEAFHTSIHVYQVGGELHHANASDPQIPAALAPVVAGITSLNDFYPKPLFKKGPRGIYNPQTQKMRPDLTVQAPGFDFLYVVPGDAATIYNSPIKQLNPAAKGTQYDGTGATIGIVGDSFIYSSQNANYQSLFGLTANGLHAAPPTLDLDGANPGENGDAVEAYLDTEVSNGIAPGAKVIYYYAANTKTQYGIVLAAQKALSENKVDVLSVSFGECEAGLGTSGNQLFEGLWKQAAAQGISVTVSTGDSGSAGCDDPNTETLAQYGLEVNGLASTPYNIAVGGTDFGVLGGPDGSGADFTNYVSATSDATTKRSAKGFIAEIPWNDSNFTFPETTVATNTPTLDSNGNPNIAAASGGSSSCVVSTVDKSGDINCQSGYAKPSWQVTSGVPNDKVRDIPDLSLFASDGNLLYATWGICTDQSVDQNDNPVEDCTPNSNGLKNGEFYIFGVGGTSSAAPAVAGILALLRQSTGERQGQAAYALYNLSRVANGAYHDVTSGNNSVPCQPGTLNCSQNSVGNYFLTGYNAEPGYDLASGLGSVNVSYLLSKWAASGLAPTTTQLTTFNPTSISHGEPVTVDATVTSASGFATGNVTLTAEVAAPLNPTIGTYPLNATGSTGDFEIRTLPGGSYKVVATYGGSTQAASSVSAPVTVTVTAEKSTTAITLSSYNPTTGAPLNGDVVPYGYPLNITAQPYGNHSTTVKGVVVPDGTATGTVKFTNGTQVLGSVHVASDGFAALTGLILPAGSHAISADYSGDASFDPSAGASGVKITKAATTVALSVNETTYAGKPFVFTATVDTNSAGEPPTGDVELKIGGKVIGSAKVAGAAGTKTTRVSGLATITNGAVPAGNSRIVAVYSGDDNYETSTSSPVGVSGRPTFSIAVVSYSLPGEHTTGAEFIPTTSEGGYTGTVNFTCALTSSTNAAAPPECAMYPAMETLASGQTVEPELLIFGKGTKLPTGITLGSNATWLGAGGAVLACGLLLGIPARRRAWKSMLSVVLLLVTIAGLSSCATTPKVITSGQYVFTVTGVDSKDASNTASAQIKVRVL